MFLQFEEKPDAYPTYYIKISKKNLYCTIFYYGFLILEGWRGQRKQEKPHHQQIILCCGCGFGNPP